MGRIRPSIPCLSALPRKNQFPIRPPGPLLSPDSLVDEEISPFYNSKNFYPATPGGILANRYQTLIKVGWGVSSTVWLARDLQGHVEGPENVVALKITNHNATSPDHEREIEECISSVDPSHPGRALFRTSLDSFDVVGPEGSHLCLAYPPTRETFSLYQRRFDNRRMPLSLIKTYIRALLTGLDYLHKECRTIHTDLKLENIMVSFEDPIVLSDFMDSQLDQPAPYKIDATKRPVHLSCNDFGPLKSLRSIPQFVDFGLATRLEEEDDWGVWPIQPDHYRAPEVILGNGWQFPTDIWNIGVLLWDLIGGEELFRHIHDQQGHYDAKLHIAEMIALLGPPPLEIMERYQYMREFTWPEPVRREDNKVCSSAGEYFDGPFFDGKGRFLYQELIPDRNLADTIPFLEEEEREEFLDLAKAMLVWHPDERRRAGDLAEHPFLQQELRI